MRPEDYQYSFDIYVPEAMADLSPVVQFAVFDSTLHGCLYSTAYEKSAHMKNRCGTWINFSGHIDATSGDITFSSFDRNPDDWFIHSFRIQMMASDFASYDVDHLKFLFYVSNIKIWREI